MPPSLSSRPATADDAALLFEIYASTRSAEIQAFGWLPAQQEAFLRMQFEARRRGYQAAHPSAEHTILLLGAAPAGSMIVSRHASGIQLIDIALLPEFQNRGLGTQILSDLIREAEAAGLPVHLSVLRGNPAMHLYLRLGFVVTSEDGMYLEMKHDTRRTQ